MEHHTPSSPPSFPIEWVDEEEFDAIETALALATSASKSSRASSLRATCTDKKDDSAGRRLPGWVNDGIKNDQAEGSRSNSTYHYYTSCEDRVSLSTVHQSDDISPEHSTEARAQRFEGEQPELSGSWGTPVIGSSSNAVGAHWGFVRPPCRVTSNLRLPSIQFKGRIIYSRTQLEVEKAASELLQIVEFKKSNMTYRVPLGFDIEWRPFFRRGEIPRKAAVLQICVDANRCDVMHIIHSGIPPLLQLLLEDVSSVKVGVCIAGDALKVHKDYNVRVREIEDISGLANRKLGGPPKRWSLCSLMEAVTCKKVEKPNKIRMGDWEVDTLSKPQLQYAATDAFASWYLYEVLKSFPDFPMDSKEEESP